MKEPPDHWTRPVPSRDGAILYGGAARAVRIAHSGGMRELVDEVARRAIELAAKNPKKD